MMHLHLRRPFALIGVALLSTFAVGDEDARSWAGEPEGRWRLFVRVLACGERSAARVCVVDNADGAVLCMEDGDEATFALDGVVDVLVCAPRHVPQYFEALRPPTSGTRTLIVRLHRGETISGVVTDDQGVALTTSHAARIIVNATPVDPPGWLGRIEERWDIRVPWCWRGAAVGPDGAFCLDGLPAGHYELRCTRPLARDGAPLLEPQPVVAEAGDVGVRLSCRRAVTVHIDIVDGDSGEVLSGDVPVCWHAFEKDRLHAAGRGALNDGVEIDVAPGTELKVAVAVDGYQLAESLTVRASSTAWSQRVTIRASQVRGRRGKVELVVRDDRGEAAAPLVLGTEYSERRSEQRDGRHVIELLSGRRVIRLSSPQLQNATDRVYLPAEVEIEVPVGGSVAREVVLQRAAVIWVPGAPMNDAVDVHLFRGGLETMHAFRPLGDDQGMAAAVEAGAYTVEGRVGQTIMKVDVAADAGRVAVVRFASDRKR